MSKKFSRLRVRYVLSTLAIAVQACGPIQVSIVTSTAASAQVASVSTPTASPSPAQATAVPASTTTVSPTATPAPVLVTATKGNVFIRRGPDQAFNPLSLLRDGQTEKALARDVLGGWVEIAFPDQPERTGWISVHTHYITVSGDVTSLPEIEPTDWPLPASLLNCSYHEMLVDPGGIVLPSLDNFPENDVTVNPGKYVIRDAETDPEDWLGTPVACQARRPGKAPAWACYSVIASVDVSEGSTIILGTDGQKKHCPVPYEDYTPRCATRPGDRGIPPCTPRPP